MRQIFFIPPLSDPHMTTAKAFETPIPGANYHVWSDGTQATGVVEMDGTCDAEKVIAALEAQGIKWLPNHLHDKTTADAMTKLHEVSGFSHLKPKRF